MARLADSLQIEPRDRVTSGDDAVVRPAGLRHQHIFVARGFGLDDVARRRCTDFLVRREQHGDRQRRRKGCARQLPDRFQREVVAALHVEDSGPETFVAFAPPLQFFQRAHRMYRVEMAGDQNAGLTLLGMRKPRADATAKTLPSGDPLDRGAHDRHVARGEIKHAIHRACVPGRAFALHPAAQASQHGLGIEGKVGGVHREALKFDRA
ncbi:hypothetical protein GALL_542460 [mine drainage metagenome]|uniref:Uncharacterized protein n=1 Tax=mine drainage metagenome TaxID=410659 RepID=A0A1J5P9N9_9ZZZZ